MQPVQLWTNQSALNNLPLRAFGTGSITTVAGSALVDGETLTLGDGVTSTTYEFDSNGVVSAGRTGIPFTGALTADQVRDAIIAAVNGTTAPGDMSGRGLVASSGGAATVTVAARLAGPQGNGTLYYETVANGTFAVVQPTGGVLSGVPIRQHGPNTFPPAGNSGVFLGLDHEDEGMLFISSRNAVAGASITATLWGYSVTTQDWHTVGPDPLAGAINGGAPIVAKTGTGAGMVNRVLHSEPLAFLSHYERLYLQLTSNTLSLNLDAWVVAKRMRRY